MAVWVHELGTQGVLSTIPWEPQHFQTRIMIFLFTFIQLLPRSVISSSSQFNFHSLFLKRVLMRTHFFTAVFPTISHWFEEGAVEAGDKFSRIYIIITFFVIYA